MIHINKEICTGCQRCCHGTPGEYIPTHHPGDRPQYDQNHRCEFLNSRNNCGILNKPIECAIYPIVISDGNIYVDMSCPAWKEAVRQWEEQFGECIDDFNDVRDDHKYVNLWIAQRQV